MHKPFLIGQKVLHLNFLFHQDKLTHGAMGRLCGIVPADDAGGYTLDVVMVMVVVTESSMIVSSLR